MRRAGFKPWPLHDRYLIRAGRRCPEKFQRPQRDQHPKPTAATEPQPGSMRRAMGTVKQHDYF
jgi:hypothetical protein